MKRVLISVVTVIMVLAVMAGSGFVGYKLGRAVEADKQARQQEAMQQIMEQYENEETTPEMVWKVGLNAMGW